jgi:hypothetical protein
MPSRFQLTIPEWTAPGAKYVTCDHKEEEESRENIITNSARHWISKNCRIFAGFARRPKFIFRGACPDDMGAASSEADSSSYETPEGVRSESDSFRQASIPIVDSKRDDVQDGTLKNDSNDSKYPKLCI